MTRKIIFSLFFIALIGVVALKAYSPENVMLSYEANYHTNEAQIYISESELRKSAEKGDMFAQNEMGVLYEKSKNHTKAVYWYNQSAVQGYALAQFNIGVAFEKGRGISRNLQEAYKWYRKAAEQGNPKAAFNLGMLYFDGRGVVKNYEKAHKWFIQSALRNNSRAMYAIGRLYHYGLGVTKDSKQAVVWYQKAVDQGSMSAKNSLALFYGQGVGHIHPDRFKALELLKSSACQGYSMAQKNLGILYKDGTDELPADYKLAFAWFAVAYFNGQNDVLNLQNDIAKKMQLQELD